MIELLLIGTTHLNMPNNGDVLMPETSDILSPTRQQELDAFVTRCSCFEPTVICLEVAKADQESLNQRYQKYVTNPLTASEDEREQIGFRLAKTSASKSASGSRSCASCRSFKPSIGTKRLTVSALVT